MFRSTGLIILEYFLVYLFDINLETYYDIYGRIIQVLMSVSSPKNPNITSNTPTIRSLCECEIYTSIYDDNPEMKSVMENYNRQSLQRFREYEGRIQEKRQTCKEQCDKDIEQIILKDKIEKELKQRLTTLETKIDPNDIPTCICEKSITDKVEKGCLKCGYGLGGNVPGLGLIGGMALYTINLWKDAEIAAAIVLATKEGTKAGIAKGIEVAIERVITNFGLNKLGGKTLQGAITSETYNQPLFFSGHILDEYILKTDSLIDNSGGVFNIYEELGSYDNTKIMNILSATAKNVATKAEQAAAKTTTETTQTLTLERTTEITGVATNYSTAIIASIVAIIVIVLVMVIIYLILRYRRKRKMKKKIQYIKLLKE
ncbi:PIR protein, putative [Plasmodium sp.]|nr:PIR protein, putative [Plasmodium sp.]